MLGGWPEPGGDQQRAEFVPVQPNSMRLIIQPGLPHMSRGGMIEEFFFDGVPVEPGDGAHAAGDGGSGPAAGFQVPGEALNIRPPSLKQGQLVLLAPGGELPQVEFIGLAG